MIDRRALLAAAAGAISAGDTRTAATEPRDRGRNRKRRDRQSGGGRKDRRPDIVVVILDDMRSGDWAALPKTRDRLARGRWFPNYVFNCPLCSPSRVSLMTGLYVHNHRVFDNGGHSDEGGHDEFRQQGLEFSTLNYLLQNAGYRTGLSGKYLNGYRTESWRPSGWNRWVAATTIDYTDFLLNVDGETVEFTGDAYKTDVLRDYAVEFIEQAEADKPIYLQFAPPAPHGPSVPAHRHRTAFRGVQVARDASFNEADVSDKPAAVQRLPLLTPVQVAGLDDLEQNRLRTMLAADEAIVAVIDALDRAGRLSNTSVFVASDNGYMMGQHRESLNKGVPYDQSVRAPMLAWGRGFRSGRDMRLVANVDIAPTIAALTGIDLPNADGFDLLSAGVRDFVPLSMPGNRLAPDGTGIRSSELLYMEYPSGEREFYDERKDPLELANLLPSGSSFTEVSPAGLPSIASLSARTRELARCAGSGCRS